MVQGEEAASCTFYGIGTVDAYPRNEMVSIGTQTTSLEYDDLKDQLEGYKCQNTFLNKEILEHNLILKRRSERERKLIK